MTRCALAGRPARLVAGSIVATCLSVLSFVAAVPVAADSVPAKLTDQEFWTLVSTFSEANGFFRSDNLLSNEMGFQSVIPELVKTTRPGRVYLGVGPEQNFTYIAATRPSMAFILDIRRGNLDLQLMYKALFELSADRVEFVSRLFSKPRPSGLTTASTAAEIFAAFRDVQSSDELHAQNLRELQHHLTVTHGFALAPEDVTGVEYAFNAFYIFGPRIQYASTGNFGGPGQPTYADLMSASDGAGVERSFLATEENFRILKDLETRNLIVPVVGNFGGPKALRAIARYLKEKDATVSTFYLSNVEQYLRIDDLWETFCASVAAMPLDGRSMFIRSVRKFYAQPTGLSSEVAPMQSEVKDCR